MGSRPPGFMWARASLRDRDGWCGPETLSLSASASCRVYPAISLATATAGRPRCPLSASRPPDNLPSTRIRARIIAPVTPLPPSTVLAPSIGGFGLKAAPCPLPERPVPRAILLGWRLVGRVRDQALQTRREHLHLPLFSGMVAAHVV